MNIKTIERANLLKLKEIPLKENFDENIEHLTQMHYAKFGQLKIPIICVVSGAVRVVDGMAYINTLLAAGATQIKANFIGELSLLDFISLRLYMNFANERTHFLNIAELISLVVKVKKDIDTIANKTNLTPLEVERYSELLNFDWDEFRRTEIDKSQIKLFEI